MSRTERELGNIDELREAVLRNDEIVENAKAKIREQRELALQIKHELQTRRLEKRKEAGRLLKTPLYPRLTLRVWTKPTGLGVPQIHWRTATFMYEQFRLGKPALRYGAVPKRGLYGYSERALRKHCHACEFHIVWQGELQLREIRKTCAALTREGTLALKRLYHAKRRLQLAVDAKSAATDQERLLELRDSIAPSSSSGQ